MLYKLLLIGIALLSASHEANCTKYFSKTASIQFDASGPLEKITSKNNSAALILQSETGEIQTSVIITSFVFDKQLMQEHFNENYMESEKFPKAQFKGRIVNNNTINYSKNGSYSVSVQGQLTMHGVTRDIQSKATVVIIDGKIQVETQFVILLSEFDIRIPGAVKDKLSNQVSIQLKGTLTRML